MSPRPRARMSSHGEIHDTSRLFDCRAIARRARKRGLYLSILLPLFLFFSVLFSYMCHAWNFICNRRRARPNPTLPNIRTVARKRMVVCLVLRWLLPLTLLPVEGKRNGRLSRITSASVTIRMSSLKFATSKYIVNCISLWCSYIWKLSRVIKLCPKTC